MWHGLSSDNRYNIRMITAGIRNFLINLTGYFIYKKAHLPVGVDFKEDLLNKFKINPSCMFDVGANYGQTALHYHTLFNKASIYAFEPVEKSFLALKDNTKHLSTVKCFKMALGNENKTMDISLHDEANSQLNSLKEINSSQNDHSLKETISVSTLQNFADQHHISHIDVLKIDTEGYEMEVLQGATQFLKEKKIAAVLCEVALSKKNTRNTQLNQVIEFLEPYDYFFVGLYETNVNYYREGLAYSNALFIKAR